MDKLTNDEDDDDDAEETFFNDIYSKRIISCLFACDISKLKNANSLQDKVRFLIRKRET